MENKVNEHDTKISSIQQDLIDIKTRLGIKDITNGQVVKYQEELLKKQEDEVAERKAQDSILREDIQILSNRIWELVIGVFLLVALEVLFGLLGVL